MVVITISGSGDEGPVIVRVLSAPAAIVVPLSGAAGSADGYGPGTPAQTLARIDAVLADQPA